MSKFELQIAAFNKKTKKVAEKIVRGSALTIFSAVVKRTPVGNKDNWLYPELAPEGYAGGRLRANWQIGIGFRPLDKLDKLDKSGGVTIKNAGSGLGRYRLGAEIYIMNNLEYAAAVENGSSKQAPYGMVKVTVTEWNHIIAMKVRENKS